MGFIYFDCIVMPLLIFLARIIDVSLGTVRIIFVNKGHKIWAPILGFFEVFIWVVVVARLVGGVSNFWIYFAYAFGFSVGTYVGIFLDEKLCVGKVMIRLIIKKNNKEVLSNLREESFPLTIINAESGRGKKKVLVVMSVINRKKLGIFLRVVNKTNPKAFYSIEDVRMVRDKDYLPVSSGKSLNFLKKRK